MYNSNVRYIIAPTLHRSTFTFVTRQGLKSDIVHDTVLIYADLMSIDNVMPLKLWFKRIFNPKMRNQYFFSKKSHNPWQYFPPSSPSCPETVCFCVRRRRYRWRELGPALRSRSRSHQIKATARTEPPWSKPPQGRNHLIKETIRTESQLSYLSPAAHGCLRLKI